MTPLAPSFQLLFSLSPPVGGDPPETQTQGLKSTKHDPEPRVSTCLKVLPSTARLAVQILPQSSSRSTWAQARERPEPSPQAPESPLVAAGTGGRGGGVTARLLLPPPRSSIHFPAPPGTTPLFSWVLVPSTPSNLNSPQQGDLGGQGLRHGPSAAAQAAQAVREGPRSSGSHLRAGAAPLTPRPPPRQEGGGPAGAPAAGIHLRGAPQLSPGLSPPNLNSPQQGDLGGQGLRHSPSAVPQAAEAVREGSRSSGSHSRLARRCGAAHPASSSTTGGGGSAGAPAAGNHFRGTPPALTGPLAASQPAAVNFVGAPKPTSDPPGASRSGRHLELLFTGAAGSPYEGEPPAFHRFAPTNFSTGPRDTGAPCTAFFRSFGPQWLRADDGGIQSTLRVRPPS
ncbi:hypothetical protein NDU88_004795 [Pleurodeles waltl]|uniref:Uncharacterized protein n=1 Tax=Pleurodeles waltl TaxID=8319 RepID=A0AAV7LS28_PLEWA|nr:hypothetical protein NDU88_004795 [Pleurodeles waltl]